MPDGTELTLMGAGAASAVWFASKIFGPSVDGLGQSLKVYLTDRWSKISARAGQIAQEQSISPEPINPGLLTRMIMDASSSNDDQSITDWWANLILDASIGSSNKHTVFSDMMSMLGPIEAHCLEEFVSEHKVLTSLGLRQLNSCLAESTFETAMSRWIVVEDAADKYSSIEQGIINHRYEWPLRATEWRLWRRFEGQEPALWNGLNPWYEQNFLALNILQRIGALKSARAYFPAFGGTSWVHGLVLTELGYEFYRTCKGVGPATVRGNSS